MEIGHEIDFWYGGVKEIGVIIHVRYIRGYPIDYRVRISSGIIVKVPAEHVIYEEA